MKKDIKEKVELPQGINAEVDDNAKHVKVSGNAGQLEKSFKVVDKVHLKLEGNSIVIYANKATKREKKMIKTIKAHIKNMIKGLMQPWVYKLQICSSHFPMSVSVDKEKGLVIIKNFLGENKERTAKILPGVDVQVKGDIIEVKSIDKEKAGQTAANIEQATRITKLDRRIFQDGIWIIEKAGKPV